MSGEKRLAVTFLVTVLILAGEVAGGWYVTCNNNLYCQSKPDEPGEIHNH